MPSANSSYLTKAERRRLRKLEKRDRLNSNRLRLASVSGMENIPSRVKPLEAQTEAQGHYIIAIQNSKLTFGLGPAGTGKTYVCAAMAADALLSKEVDRIILTRPTVETGDSLGFLPGDIDEKFEPYIAPFRDVLNERMNPGTIEYMLKNKKIECVPLAYMRGRTFDNSWVILDEAQNSTPMQMKMFLTRIGKNAKVVVNGDPSQRDIEGRSGLEDAVCRLRNSGYVSVVEFHVDDVVRSGLAREILLAYRD